MCDTCVTDLLWSAGIGKSKQDGDTLSQNDEFVYIGKMMLNVGHLSGSVLKLRRNYLALPSEYDICAVRNSFKIYLQTLLIIYLSFYLISFLKRH